MPTNQEEKPVKPRSRSRKTDQRNSKAEAKAQAAPEQVALEQVKLEAEPVDLTIAPVETAAVDLAPVDTIPADTIAADTVAVEVAMEKTSEAALNGEVLPPAVRDPATPSVGLPAIAQAYAEYTRKSWLSGRFLVERLIAMRSFDEAIEIQGEFAKQVYANFMVQSERICVLYGEWALGFFRPFEQFAAGWPKVGR